MWVCAGIQRLIRHMDQGQTMHIRAVQCRDICKMLTILNIKIEPASQWLRDMASKQHAHASSANGTKLSINSDTCAHTTRACSTSGVELANHVIYIQSATRIRCAYSHCYQYTLTEPCNNQAIRINRKIAPPRHYPSVVVFFPD